MKYKIFSIALLFLGCSRSELDPESVRMSDKKIELREKIMEETNLVSIVGGRHSQPDPQIVKNLRQHKMELMELEKSH